MGIEFELKFRATPEILDAIEKNVAGEKQHFQMATTYYDTPDRKLKQVKYTLRRRLENGVSVCTLKTPADTLGRREYELECDTIEEALEKLCKLPELSGLADLVAGGVRKVCGARFQRRAITVSWENCTVELALDEGVLTGGGVDLPLREVEVELKTGSREQATLYAQLLAAKYGLEPEKLSKFQRATMLAEGLFCDGI